MNNERRDEILLEMHGSMTGMQTEIGVLNGCVQDIYKTLKGNGQPGLVKDLERIKQSQIDCQERQKQQPAITNNRLVIVGVVTSVVISLFISPLTAFGVIVVSKKMGF